MTGPNCRLSPSLCQLAFSISLTLSLPLSVSPSLVACLPTSAQIRQTGGLSSTPIAARGLGGSPSYKAFAPSYQADINTVRTFPIKRTFFFGTSFFASFAHFACALLLSSLSYRLFITPLSFLRASNFSPFEMLSTDSIIQNNAQGANAKKSPAATASPLEKMSKAETLRLRKQHIG